MSDKVDGELTTYFDGPQLYEGMVRQRHAFTDYMSGIADLVIRLNGCTDLGELQREFDSADDDLARALIKARIREIVSGQVT